LGAVWARARSGFRRSLWSSVAIVLMIGVASAAVLASAAGARRTDTAYQRFREYTNGFDSMAIGCADGMPWPAIAPAAAELPQVRDSIDVYYLMGYPSTTDGQTLFNDEPNLEGGVVGITAPSDVGKVGMKVLEGRLPDPESADEVAVSYSSTMDPKLQVGDTIDIRLLKTDADLEVAMSNTDLPPGLFTRPIPVKVVGFMLMSGPGNEVRGDSHDILATPAFGQKYGASGLDCGGQFYWLNRGQADAPAFLASFQEASPGTVILAGTDEATYVDRNTRLTTTTMWLFAALVAVAGLIIFGQALARQTALQATENPILRALGMTPAQLFGVSIVKAFLTGLAAAAVAVALTVAVSGYLLTGIARLVEPEPGTFVDLTVLIGGFVFVVAAVMLISVIPAWRASRVRGDALGTSVVEEGRRPSAIASVAVRAGAPAPMTTGMKLALEPGRGRTAVPVRSAIIGLVLALVALVASMTFASSLQHLLDTPRLRGINFETATGNPYAPTMKDVVAPMLAGDPALENIAAGNFANGVLLKGPNERGITVNVWGLEPLEGTQHPTITDGIWPTAEGEIALGAKTMRDVGAKIGDEVTVTAEGNEVDLRVVGQAVYPDFGFGPGLGEGAGITFSQLLGLFPKADQNLYLMDVKDGADLEELKARTTPTLKKFGMQELQVVQNEGTGDSLTQTERSKSVPTLLAGVVALMAVAMLTHTLLSSIRRRRRDLAILKTLGFTRGQVSWAVAWQASTLAIVASLIGVPLGAAIGRWAWNVFAENLGVVPEPVVPVSAALLLIPATLIIANLIAVLPGVSAGRTKPSIVLRAE